MNIEELQNLYLNSLGIIFQPDVFKKIADHSSKLHGYSFSNRALILLQNPDVTEAKSRESWELDGLVVKNRRSGVYVVNPVIEVKYIDNETNQPINASELNQSEFSMALSLGVIRKEVNIVDFSTTELFTYDDIDNKPDNRVENPRKLKLSTLYDLLKQYRLDVVKKQKSETSFNSEKNTIIIGSDSIQNKISVCVDALVECIINSIDKNELSIEDKEVVISIAKLYSNYSILTYFNMDSAEAVWSKLNNCLYSLLSQDIDALVYILDNIESIISNYILFPDTVVDENRKHYIAKKAERLLNILESNYQRHKLEG